MLFALCNHCNRARTLLSDSAQFCDKCGKRMALFTATFSPGESGEGEDRIAIEQVHAD